MEEQAQECEHECNRIKILVTNEYIPFATVLFQAVSSAMGLPFVLAGLTAGRVEKRIDDKYQARDGAKLGEEQISRG
ncbi:hypothetical protein CC80DRAFT_487565 [Byssothecium circinans]|uniref:Uncharacterized protein n=1 Tax=Byssothecium circinans TaxID=147558 RepID=A0A6A5UE24_9PLEO|nr:hypothetical protein CC80DRAFT_487565 [Byssothecium circinans]